MVVINGDVVVLNGDNICPVAINGDVCWCDRNRDAYILLTNGYLYTVVKNVFTWLLTLFPHRRLMELQSTS